MVFHSPYLVLKSKDHARIISISKCVMMSGTLFFLGVENVQDGSFLDLHIHASLINSNKQQFQRLSIWSIFSSFFFWVLQPVLYHARLIRYTSLVYMSRLCPLKPTDPRKWRSLGKKNLNVTARGRDGERESMFSTNLDHAKIKRCLEQTSACISTQCAQAARL